MMQALGVSPGIGIAQVMIWQPPINYGYIPRKTTTPAIDAERFKAALGKVMDVIATWAENTARRIGTSEATIFEAYGLILGDEESVSDPILEMIHSKGYSAEYAVFRQFEEMAQTMRQLDNEYLRQRADDIYGLREQLMREMLGMPSLDASHLDRPTIVVAQTLSTPDLTNLDRSRLEAIVCESGSYTTHTAIVARTLGIPAVMGAEGILSRVKNGTLLAVDGGTGEIWIDPCKEEIGVLRQRNAELTKQQDNQKRLRGVPTVSMDGHRVELSANIAQTAEVHAALEADAESLGLYRTELLHMNRNSLPNEEEQFRVYRHVIERMHGKAVTVRTLDVPDRPGKLVLEEQRGTNPALGYRGIRMSLGRPSMFRTQIRALLRASAYGCLKVMFPMVCSQQEVVAARSAVHSIMQELQREGVPYDAKLPLGVMVEIPAAALIADSLAQHADFLTIGVNDLIQFTLAVDRSNQKLANLYSLCHPAVLKLIKMTIDAAHRQGIPCCVCGEVPQQDITLPLLMGLGADGFSLNPRDILPARQILNQCQFASQQHLAGQVLSLASQAEVQQAVQALLRGEEPLADKAVEFMV